MKCIIIYADFVDDLLRDIESVAFFKSVRKSMMICKTSEWGVL